MKLPPSVSAAVFNQAISRFQEVVGKDWVFVSEEDVDLYRDAYSPFKGEPDKEFVASAAVAPQSVEEVQAIVKIANELKVPLYPISTGKNLGYGGSAPAMSGSVVLDLKRMNRIIEVNEVNAYVLVEPGVSYMDLDQHLREKGYRLWVDTPDPGWGSLIGNALERGGGWTSSNYRDHWAAHCGMEVVLPSGELVRTGMGAMPAARTWQQYKHGFGPQVDGIFSQSNYGVCTKMGFWLMPQPEASYIGIVQVPKYEDLIPLVETVNYLENAELFTGLPIFFGPLTYNKYIRGPVVAAEALPDGLVETLMKFEKPPYTALEKFCADHKMGMWGVEIQFYGPPEVIEAQWAYCKKRFSAIPGATMEDGEMLTMPLSEEKAKTAHKVTYGIANLEAFVAVGRTPANPNGSAGHLCFAPIIPRDGREILKAQQVFAELAKELQIGVPGWPPIVGMTNFTRSFVFTFNFPVSEDPAVNEKTRAAFKTLVKTAAEHGWGEYRTPPAFYETIKETYSFNNFALHRLHETLKDAIDPNGIISPGRYAIWPKNMRKS